MNVVYAAISAPVGALSDRIGRHSLLAVGLGVLVVADAVLALFPTIPGALAGAALWGLHMGLTQGLFSALIADTAPERLRGTAFGVFNLATGVALLAASAIAGEVWAHVSPAATFLTGGGFALVSLIGLGVVAARKARAA
jgi:MFS family permease